MPRNVLKGKTDEQLAMEFALRNSDPRNSPTKLYSTVDVWTELKNRLDYEEATRLFVEAQKTLALMG